MQMTVASIQMAGLGSIQAFPLILFTENGQQEGPGGVYASGRQTATWPSVD
jgi:hypothetical protein